MITADKLRKMKITSTYQTRLEKAVKQEVKSNKRYIKRELIKAHKQNDKSFEFEVCVPKGFKREDYRKAFEKYFQNLGFKVSTSNCYNYNKFDMTLYW